MFRPVAPPVSAPTTSSGFCNYGPDGTGASSTCEGGPEGGEWCNRSSSNCLNCSGRWCTSNSGSNPSLGGFCNYGPDGTGASSTCEGGPEGGEWCNRSSSNCLNCSGRWCTSSSGSNPSPSGFCNYGPDGTGASSTCEGGPEGGEWCNRSSSNCLNCSGRWCT